MAMSAGWNMMRALGRAPVLLGSGAAVSTLHGQEEDLASLAHAFQQDPVEEWLSSSLAVILAVGVAIILYSLVRYRGRLPGRC